MTTPQTALILDDDREVIRACVERPTLRAWDKFFRHFEPRFRSWIRSTLRDSNEPDREDAYQNLAKKLLSGKILPLIDLSRDPERYLRRSVRNLARRQHEQTVGLAEEPLDDDVVLSDRLRLLADQASPAPEGEIFERLKRNLLDSDLGEKRLKTFLALLEDRRIKEITRRTGFSKSSVGRYIQEIEAAAYAALGVPLPDPKKN